SVELVAYACPGGFLARRDVQAIFPGKALGGGYHQRGTVGQRDEANFQAGFFWSIGTGRPGGTAQTVRGGQAQAGNTTYGAGQGNGLFQETAAALGLGFVTLGHGKVLL